MKQLFNVDTLVGKVSINVDEDAERKVPYLYFHNIFTPAKGKKPAAIFTQTVSEYKNLAGSVAVVPEDVISKLVALQMPLLNASAKSDNNILKDTFSIVDKMVAEYDATKESTSGPVLRKVDESITGLLARILLVKAGVSGEIPNMLDISSYLTGAVAEAHKIATENGKDTLGQFRLKKAKEKKAEENKPETSSTDENPLDLDAE